MRMLPECDVPETSRWSLVLDGLRLSTLGGLNRLRASSSRFLSARFNRLDERLHKQSRERERAGG